jgi:hypothetical protein
MQHLAHEFEFRSVGHCRNLLIRFAHS